MSKDAGNDALHGDAVCHSTNPAERKLVLDGVDEQGAMFSGVLGFAGLNAVTLPPVAKGSAKLPVTEAMIPMKVFNLRNPGHAHR